MKLPILLALCLPQAPADSELVRVPFQNDMGLILLELRVGEGDPLTFLLDSGASGMVIDRAAAKEHGLRLEKPQTRGKTADRGELTYNIIPSATFRMGDYEFQQRQFIAAPVRATASVMIGRSVHGILGHTFLAEHTLEVDYVRNELTVHDPETYEYRGEGASLPLRFEPALANLPFTTVSVGWESGEEHSFDALVDSGGSLLAIVCISDPSTRKTAIPANVSRSPTLGATGLANTPEGSSHASFATRLHRMRIGPFAIEQPSVGCSPKEAGLNLFGAELLHRFHVVFDYARQRLILAPNEAFDEPKLMDRSGMVLFASEDDLTARRITFLTPGGPAEEAGLQLDDHLLEINGHPASTKSLNATRKLFFELGEFRLKVRRGEEIVGTTLHTRDLF